MGVSLLKQHCKTALYYKLLIIYCLLMSTDLENINPGSAQDHAPPPADDAASVRTYSTNEPGMDPDRDSIISRGRASITTVGRASLGAIHYAGDRTAHAMRESIEDVRRVVGPLRKSYFAVRIGFKLLVVCGLCCCYALSVPCLCC